MLSLIGDGRYWSVSFAPSYCTRLPTGANCPPSSIVAITPSPQLELQFGAERETGLPEGAKRWWVDVDHDNQLDYCWADGNNTTMACAYNRELSFTAVRATSSGVDLGWTEGAEWVHVSSLQAPDFCRLVDSSTKIRCSRVARPGVAGGLWEGGDFVSAHIDAGYPRDRFWGDVGNAAGAADGRSDFCRILDYGHPQGGYALGCQLASATGTFGGEWRGDVLLPLTNDMSTSCSTSAGGIRSASCASTTRAASAACSGRRRGKRTSSCAASARSRCPTISTAIIFSPAAADARRRSRPS